MIDCKLILMKFQKNLLANDFSLCWYHFSNFLLMPFLLVFYDTFKKKELLINHESRIIIKNNKIIQNVKKKKKKKGISVSNSINC